MSNEPYTPCTYFRGLLVFFFSPFVFFLTSAYSSIESANGNGNGIGDANGFINSNSHNSTASTGTDSLSGSKPGSRVLEAGEVAGDYSMDWKGEEPDRGTERRGREGSCAEKNQEGEISAPSRTVVSFFPRFLIILVIEE